MFSTACKGAQKFKFPIHSSTVNTVIKGAQRSGTTYTYHVDPSPDLKEAFGNFYEPTKIEFTQSNFDVFGATGKLLSNWWWGEGGGGGKPPVIKAELNEGKNPKVDTSGCRLAFLHAMVGILKTHFEKRKKAEEASHDPGESPPSEPEGVMLKASNDDSKQAINDLAECLKKGKTTPEAVRDMIMDEAKSALKDIVTSKFTSGDPIKSFGAKTATIDQDYGKNFVSLRHVQKAEAEKIIAAINGYANEAGSVFDDFKAHMSNTSKLFEGMTKDYKVIVKDSDGLTSMRPGVVKALEKARDTGDSAHIATALGELKKQRADVTKQGGKTATEFLKELDKFEKEWLL